MERGINILKDELERDMFHIVCTQKTKPSDVMRKVITSMKIKKKKKKFAMMLCDIRMINYLKVLFPTTQVIEGSI